MKKSLLGLAIIAMIASSCTKDVIKPVNPHVPGADCGSCHAVQQSQWASPKDLHALSATAVLTTKAHNSVELLNNNCLKCHSTFQYPLGIAHFVTPVNKIGSPPGTWTALNTGDWQATKCEVCHDPTSTSPMKLAKYGSELDGPWKPSYIDLSTLPTAYQKVISLTTGDTTTYIYPNQNSLTVLATKLCNSCHDPADEGDDPAIIINGINYGPQGGDSRVYVGVNHHGFGCIDCHDPHTFQPINPKTKPACAGCHSVTQKGKVHLNHLED